MPKASGPIAGQADKMLMKNGQARLGARKEKLMTQTAEKTREDGVARIIQSVQDSEQVALEAVRKFIDTVDGAFPDVGEDGGLRRKIIDSAFNMTEQLVGASNSFALKLVEGTEDAFVRSEKASATPKK